MTYLEKGLQIIGKINEYGYKAYLVGGAVRDYLLQMPIHDIDIATNMPLEEISKIFVHTLSCNSEAYQSITIIVDDDKYEITHFRKDLAYNDHRHPTVQLVESLKEDVVRRDFTINALAMDTKCNIFDYFTGLQDLKNHLIRTIGDPQIRFFEDALRILRACSFAGRLDFLIEANTLNAMKDNAKYLAQLSNERIYQYFIMILQAKSTKGIEYLKDNNLLEAKICFKKWLDIWNDHFFIQYLGVYYFLSYNELPPIVTTNEKKIISVIKSLEKNNYSSYSIYKERLFMPTIIKIFASMGCNNGLAKKFASLPLKDDKDLALPLATLAKMIPSNKRSSIIKNLFESILNGKISNDKDEIIKYLESLSE